IGHSGFGLGTFRRPLRPVVGRWGGRASLGVLGRGDGRISLVAGRLAAFLVCLGRLLVGLAPVVGLVEARALEDDGRPGAEYPSQAEFPARRTLFERFIVD